MQRANPSNNPATRVKAGPGRPLAIDRIVGHNPDGTEISAGDRIIQLITLGFHPYVAADAGCMSVKTLAAILGDGAALSDYLTKGRRTTETLSVTERAKLAFSDRFNLALSQATVNNAVLIAQAIRGGTVLTTTSTSTKVTEPGVWDEGRRQWVGRQEEVTTTEKRETLGPSEAMIRWHAERRWRPAYGTQVDITVHTADLLAISEDDRVASLVEDATRFLTETAGVDVIDVEEATVSDEPGPEVPSPHAPETDL